MMLLLANFAKTIKRSSRSKSLAEVTTEPLPLLPLLCLADLTTFMRPRLGCLRTLVTPLSALLMAELF